MPIPELTPDQRFHQVATILAKAVLRYQRQSRQSQVVASNEPPKSSLGGLEVPAKTRLSVSRGVGG